VWRGFAVDENGKHTGNSLVLKRMLVGKGRDHILRAAKREIYFGQLLLDDEHCTSLVSHFVVSHSDGEADEHWLVFADEGVSLRHIAYALTAHEGRSAIFEPSNVWRRLRTTSAGADAIRGLMQQVILSVAQLHARGLAHRDIKPSNILLNSETGDTRVILGDFSSAVDAEALERLYGIVGPGEGELTLSYAPPEVRLASASDQRAKKASIESFQQYDIWSVGVVFLELLLGTDDVFTVDERTAATIQMQMRRVQREPTKRSVEDALFLAALRDFCIFTSDGSGGSEGSKSSCHEGAVAKSFANAVRKRDPLGLGLRDEAAADLLLQLLQFDPRRRLPLKSALRHRYFSKPAAGADAGSGSEAEGGEDDFARSPSLSLNMLGTSPLRVARTSIQAQTQSHSQSHADKETEAETTDFDEEEQAIDDDLGPAYAGAPSVSEEEDIVFTCPKCNRAFGDWSSCHRHMLSRKHNTSAAGKRCLYSSHSLPDCSSQHSLLPLDPSSGWCDLVGRRRRLEDTHTLLFGPDTHAAEAEAEAEAEAGGGEGRPRLRSVSFSAFYGVFDGHQGSRASRWAAKFLPRIFEHLLADTQTQGQAQEREQDGQDQVQGEGEEEEREDRAAMSLEGQAARLKALNPSLAPLSSASPVATASPQELIRPGAAHLPLSIGDAAQALSRAFAACSDSFVSQHRRELSGTTAAVAVLFPSQGGRQLLLVANAGDSRVVLCCPGTQDKGRKEGREESAALVLTLDHTPEQPRERARVLRRGGFVASATADDNGARPRVNGSLAVTRAIGDAPLAHLLSAEPDVLALWLTHPPQPLSPPLSQEQRRSWEGESSCERLRLLVAAAPGQALFLILGSDGLFDVLSNDEAADLVCDVLTSLLKAEEGRGKGEGEGRSGGFLQEAARALAHEAYVRGSSDNIGACVVGLGSLLGALDSLERIM